MFEISHRLNFNLRFDFDIYFRTRFIGFDCRGRKGGLWGALTGQARRCRLCAHRTAHRRTISTCAVATCAVTSRAVASQTIAACTSGGPARTATGSTRSGLAGDHRGIPSFTHHTIRCVRHLSRLPLIGRAWLHAGRCATGAWIAGRHGPIGRDRHVAILSAITSLRNIPAALLRLITCRCTTGSTRTTCGTIAHRHCNRLRHGGRFVAGPEPIPTTH